VVNKAQRHGHLPTPFKTQDELKQGLDETLFHSSRYYNPHVVLYRLGSYRDLKTHHRLRDHKQTLPSDVGSTARQNFITRMLFTDMYWSVFSERELKSSCSLYVIGSPSVCRLSVCNVRARYSGDWNFRQYFYATWYLDHLWPLYKNFTEIVPGEPLRRES